jgi:hypothetical protein
MTDAPTTPSTPNPTTNEMLMQLYQSVLGLLGLFGVAVPPIFSNLAVEQHVVGVVALLLALAWAAYQRLVTKPAEVHAAATASARAGKPLRLR